MEKGFLAFDSCLVFISWNQSGYRKANKSLCLCMHSKFGKLIQMQVGYGKIFKNYVQKITASKRCINSFIEAYIGSQIRCRDS